MNSIGGRIALDVVLTIVGALLILGSWQWFLGRQTFGNGLGQAASMLFLFMGVGLAAWVILLVVFALRRRPAGIGRTLLFAYIGTAINVVAAIVVGLVQGGWALGFVVVALIAGLAVLVVSAIAVPLVHRVILRPSTIG